MKFLKVVEGKDLEKEIELLKEVGIEVFFSVLNNKIFIED